MSNTTYSSELFRPQNTTLAELLRELFAATPLGIFIAALRSTR